MLRVWCWDDKSNAGVHCLPNCKLVYFVNAWILWACSSSDTVRNLCMHAFASASLECIYCSLLGKLPRLLCCNSNLKVVTDGRMYNQITCSHGPLHDYHKTIVPNFGGALYNLWKLRNPSFPRKIISLDTIHVFRGFESLWVIFIYFMFKNLLQLHTICRDISGSHLWRRQFGICM